MAKLIITKTQKHTPLDLTLINLVRSGLNTKTFLNLSLFSCFLCFRAFVSRLLKINQLT
jgi:hypothetical protein